ncbi:hypothetical protein BJY52DRAFT_1229618 [Lactarius psammicola]|nr:hypothetical protein BJY52DRAFT_1229618 [Lactarius psammicola]
MKTRYCGRLYSSLLRKRTWFPTIWEVEPRVLVGQLDGTLSLSVASTIDIHDNSLQGIRADAASLKLLQVSELLAWMSDNKLAMPKSKRKDDLITAIVKSSEFAQVTRSTIQEIVENRKSKKAPKMQLAAP